MLGYPIAKSRALERFLSPFIVASQSTPIVVRAAAGVVAGVRGSPPCWCRRSALYPVLVSTLIGVREVDRAYHELFHPAGDPWQRLTRLELPGALPVMLGGLRLAASLALIGAVVWEFTDPNHKGLGFRVQEAGIYQDKAGQFAAIALLVLFGVLLYGTVTVLERWAARRRGQ